MCHIDKLKEDRFIFLKIVEIYGKDRPEMTEPEDRYKKIKAALNV